MRRCGLHRLPAVATIPIGALQVCNSVARSAPTGGSGMDSMQPLGGRQEPASSPLGSSATLPYVPPPAAWRPSTLVRRLPVKIKRPTSLPGWLFFLVVLAAIVVGGWYYQVVDLVTPSSPRATAKAFMRAVYAGDLDRTQALCTAATQPLLAPLKQAAKLAQSSSQNERPEDLSWRATAVLVTGDQATVTISQTLKQGGSTKSSEFPLALTQENGKWKVDLTGGLEMVLGLSGLVGRY